MRSKVIFVTEKGKVPQVLSWDVLYMNDDYECSLIFSIEYERPYDDI